MAVFVTSGQIVDARHDDRVDDDHLTEEDDFAAGDTCTKHGPRLLAVCIAWLHDHN